MSLNVRRLCGGRLLRPFDFSLTRAIFERLTPAFLNFKFLAPPPAEVHPGTVIDYQIQLYGVPVHWRTRIEVVEAPNRFVDVQEKGPYALWRHSHSFRNVGGGATEIKDRVEYAMPLGVLGEIAYRLFVARSLAQIFDYREKELAAVMARGKPNP